jgi:hypothetical protein
MVDKAFDLLVKESESSARLRRQEVAQSQEMRKDERRQERVSAEDDADDEQGQDEHDFGVGYKEHLYGRPSDIRQAEGWISTYGRLVILLDPSLDFPGQVRGRSRLALCCCFRGRRQKGRSYKGDCDSFVTTSQRLVATATHEYGRERMSRMVEATLERNKSLSAFKACECTINGFLCSMGPVNEDKQVLVHARSRTNTEPVKGLCVGNERMTWNRAIAYTLRFRRSRSLIDISKRLR